MKKNHIKLAFVFILFLSSFALAKTQVAITIDDLPSHGPLPTNISRVQITKKILSILKSNHIPEVYGFINAKKLEESSEHIEVLKLWRTNGYPLGNHTFSHLDLTKTSVKDFKHEIELNEPVLNTLANETNWHFFRYPFLREGESLEKRNAIRDYLKSKNYQIAQVSVDFEDWAWNAPYARCVNQNNQKAISWLKSTYLKNAIDKLHRSKKLSQALFKKPVKLILLLHLGGFDAEMLNDLILAYKNDGVEFIGLTEASTDEIYSIDPSVPADSGEDFFPQILASRNLKLADVGLKHYTDYPEAKLKNICR